MPVGLVLESDEQVKDYDSAVEKTLLNARAPTTHALYALGWKHFPEWCACHYLDLEY